MSSLISLLRNTSTLVSPLCFLLLLSSTSSLYQGLYFEEKTRLGSTPPRCHNKCNGCHPCMAVQVPSPFQRADSSKAMEVFGPASANQYSNYKPLGWKCRCDDHFYNP
ncbi:EPIDERMAL PATTERNING FACTOR-like protein 1 [Hibiscus syriacus]|uniref:Epidermal patterning factor-like protein n=1 Tax=Hibiscus syriacus TaxID=106335 RepID=A0A6A2ZN06_HIBSY|nr:EPIDERMAL PATTERNING FACTOR-like protein 1 [Hibiscus syriacus]KAE8693238.1 EPIDERMAL PATTERNING FACTOR-like protein 1 [Hibiscus syriacus]